MPLLHHLDGLDIVHGALCSPELFDYVQTSYDASLSMAQMQAPVCFIGHSHVPIIFIQESFISYSLEKSVKVRDETRIIVNVGSVGQPRDLDPRASYAILDTHERIVNMHRVEYDVEQAADRIIEAGLPATNAQRLYLGR